VWAQVKALESLLAANGKLPLNVRVIFEGEEEVGGEGIEAFVASKPPELKADFALVSDTELFAPGLPTLCVGLRGMIYTELEVRGAKTDLHSGMYGGAAPNPFVALAQMLAKLKDENGHILIPGFYDDIIPPSPEELAAWRSLPFDEEHYRKTEVGSRNWWARPATACWSAPGRGPRSTCTASPAASSARAPRP
jgi:acetylornithine deacetylase/succinyl-diaminopimelate desuccinylase-like protein